MVRHLNAWYGPVLFGAFVGLFGMGVSACCPQAPTAQVQNKATGPEFWEELPNAPGSSTGAYRTKVHQGWLVIRYPDLCFVPDPNHEWLKSQPEKK